MGHAGTQHTEEAMADRQDKPLLDVVAGAASVAASVVARDPLSLVAGLSDFVQSVWHYNTTRQARLLQSLLEEAYLANSSDEGAYADLRGLLEGAADRSENAKVVFIDTVRAAESAVDEAVLPGLAMAMREYQREGRRPDGFFRGFTRTLMDLSRDEYLALQAICRGLATRLRGKRHHISQERFVRLHIDYSGPASAQPAPGKVIVTHTSEGMGDPLKVEVPDCPGLHAEHVLHLLEVNGLVRQATTKKQRAVDIGISTAEQMARLLRCWT